MLSLLSRYHSFLEVANIIQTLDLGDSNGPCLVNKRKKKEIVIVTGGSRVHNNIDLLTFCVRVSVPIYKTFLLDSFKHIFSS